MNKFGKKEIIGLLLIVSGLGITLITAWSVGFMKIPSSAPKKFVSPLPSADRSKAIALTNSGIVLAADSKKETVGFLPFWLLDKKDHIPYDKLTQIAYFGLEVDDQGNLVKNLDDGTEEPGYTKMKSADFASVKDLAQKNNVKFLLTLRLMQNGPIERLLASKTAQNNLIDNTLTVIKESGFNGVNMDFEYEGSPPEKTVKSYTSLVRNMTQKVHEEIDNSVVSVSAYADAAYKARLTEIWPLSQASDHLIIMAYDFFRPTDVTAGPISPLTGGGGTYEYDITKTVADYLKLASCDKIILGLPFYGYDWPVVDGKPYSTALDTAALSSYDRTKRLIAEKNLLEKWDGISQTSYLTYADDDGTLHQIYYENPASLKLKLDLIKEKNLAGLAIWALGYEGNNQDLWQTISSSLSPLATSSLSSYSN